MEATTNNAVHAKNCIITNSFYVAINPHVPVEYYTPKPSSDQIHLISNSLGFTADLYHPLGSPLDTRKFILNKLIQGESWGIA